MNLVSCHGFTEKPNATVILNFRYCLRNNYLLKVFFMIEKDSKRLRIIPNDLKSIIHAIDQLEKYFVIAKKIIYSVANTIKKFHIQSDLHFIYK